MISSTIFQNIIIARSKVRYVTISYLLFKCTIKHLVHFEYLLLMLDKNQTGILHISMYYLFSCSTVGLSELTRFDIAVGNAEFWEFYTLWKQIFLDEDKGINHQSSFSSM